MNKKDIKHFCGGFTIIEFLISVVIFSIVLVAVFSFFFWMNYSGNKIQSDNTALENARKALRIMVLEIKRAKGIYSLTTSENQLSLQTAAYPPAGENDSFIDFFLCGSSICFKRESQDSAFLTSKNVNVTNLTFSQISTNNNISIKISLTLDYNNSSAALATTASLRSY